MKRFEDKVAIVTGAASGIGKATVARLRDEGAQVVGLDVASGDDVRQCDITDEAAVTETVDGVVAEFGGLDVLVNMAGIIRTAKAHETPVELWRTVVEVNLTGTFIVCKAALPHLIEREGTIVNAASTTSFIGNPNLAAYGASKGGVMALTSALAVEYADRRVRVNAVAPGGIVTPMTTETDFDPTSMTNDMVARISPLPAFGFASPRKVASVIAFLASDDAAHMTGTTVPVDGGTMA